jgi:Mg-chelatase subunit ChlD
VLRSEAAAQRIPPDSNYTKVRVFDVEAAGNKFVYVFDRSASMEGAPLAAAKSQLIKSLDSIDEVQQFHVFFFNQRILSFDATGSRRIAFGTDSNKKRAARFVKGVTADGGTDRFPALKQALALQPNVIFFLTDADGPMTAKEMDDIVRINERIQAQICVIEFGKSDKAPKSNFLIELARSSNGQYCYVNVLRLPQTKAAAKKP